MAVMVSEAHKKQSRGAELKIVYMLNSLMQLFRFRIGLLHMTFMEEDDTGMTSGSRAWADTFAFFLGLAIATAGLMEPAGTGDRNAYGEMMEDAGEEAVLSKDAEKFTYIGVESCARTSRAVFTRSYTNGSGSRPPLAATATAGAAAFRAPHASHSRQVVWVGVRKSFSNLDVSRCPGEFGGHGLKCTAVLSETPSSMAYLKEREKSGAFSAFGSS